MDLGIAFGIGLAIVGAATLVVALFHPKPRSVRLIQIAFWPIRNKDRTDLALSGWLFLGLGSFMATVAADVTRTVLALPIAVLIISGIALGVRHRDD